jgi:hypothetical protein
MTQSFGKSSVSSFSGELTRNVDERLTEAYDRGDIVVGVHMRREDYHGTPQLFPVGVFLNLMKNAATLLKPSKVSCPGYRFAG